MILFVFFIQMASWQQGVSYEIIAELDTDEHRLAATAGMNYHNNSISTLDTLYLYLHANAFSSEATYYAREAERMGDGRFAKMAQDAFGGIFVESVECDGDALSFDVAETILSVPLRRPLLPGDSISLGIDFSVAIPGGVREFGYRSGHYEMIYWYPKICVFDQEGWHLEPLHPLGGAYGEFASYDVTIDLPLDYVIAATGRHVEGAKTETMDGVSTLSGAFEHGERKVVRFIAENVSDFVWVCDRDYVVETRKIENINLSVFYRHKNEQYCENTIRYVSNALSIFNQWFHDYPYENLNIVDGYHERNTTHPQMVILDMREDGVTRLFESEIVEEIGRQWFGAVIGSRGSANEWLGQGLATYATIRYMEEMYGRSGSLIKTTLLPPFSLRYYHRLYYYIMQTNQLDRLVSEPPSDYAEVAIAYDNNIKSKPALFFLTLDNLYGRNEFDRVIKRYYQEYRFNNVGSEDFIETCRSLDMHDLASLVDTFANTAYYCDWGVDRVTEHSIEIENKGRLMIPIDLHVTTEFGEQIFRIDGQKRKDVVIVSDSLGVIKSVVLDPTESTLDPDYWNNYWPRNISIRPIFAFDWPSFSTYQLLWTPYLWYDAYDGVVGGFYLFGDKFADFDFVKGGYQVTSGYIYGFSSKRHYPSIRYQTPVLFRDGVRARFLCGAARARGGDEVYVGFKTDLERPFKKNSQVGINNSITYDRLSSYAGLDSIDWEIGRNIFVDNRFLFRNSQLKVEAGISLAHHAIGSEWEYLKTTFDIRKTIEFVVPFNARLFVGKIFGDAPDQHRLFLNGLLRINWFADLLFNQSGTFSPQEHLHVPGDGNMPGYQTLHIKSDQIYALNLETPARSLVRIFTDIGYYDDFAFDVGLRVVINAETVAQLPLGGLSISVNLPLYVYAPGEPWKLRWSIGFSS